MVWTWLVRSGGGSPDLPVVLVTGYAEAAASMEDGEFGLLLKPYPLEALAQVLNAELN